MADTEVRMATEKQVAYVKALFRKIKLYYNMRTDLELVHEVRERTGINLNALSFDEAKSTIEYLQRELKQSQPWRR